MVVYMTRQRALRAGFTHHGSYHGIPMWMGGIDGVPIVCSKVTLLEHLVSFFRFFEQQIGRLKHKRPIYRFMLGKKIDQTIS
ncbi:MAG: hypothetical protein ACI8WB_000748 [Phenylobacterium sp.]|jgi:hypothetical protein